MYESAYRAGPRRIAATLAASVIAASATILSISPATAAVPQVALTGSDLSGRGYPHRVGQRNQR
ncbi:hypothetical protein GCM10010528_05660 [Gordonia defluvii]|uniref:Uncharacterized protein n=1 Tax=Gordonia defluvii TaxID=283718 RepID=A0ABP6L0S6_9ACTN